MFEAECQRTPEQLIHIERRHPIVIFEIFYKMICLAIVAYPLWSTNRLAGSPAEGMAHAFACVILPIVAMPWAHAFRTYVWPWKRRDAAVEMGA